MKQDGDKMWWGIWPNKVFQRESRGMAVIQCKTAQSIEEGYWQCGRCLKCGVEVKCPGGTTNLTSHVRCHHPQLLSKTQSGAETIKETPEVKLSDGTLMSFIVICFIFTVFLYQ